ncbi:MAG: hypothetical protein M3R63_05685 [Actinomycetota bacterium]|nr:hypothetical protein [Actinomycetota bacterium]
MDMPTPDEAAAALAELEAGQRAVATAEARGLPVLLTACSMFVLADYAAKDVLAGRRARWAVSAICQLATLSLVLLDLDRTPVQPVSVDPADLGPRAAAPFIAAIVGCALAERVLVVGLRCSGVRRPNTLAGVALALARPVAYLGIQRLLPRPGHHG